MISAVINPKLTVIDSPRADLHAIPGQFCLAVAPSFDPFLPKVLFPFKIRGGLVESFVAPLPVQEWIEQNDFKVRGPYGTGFSIDPNARRVVILASNGAAAAILVPQIDSLVEHSCEVALICGGEALSESWLPAEVEYHVVDDVLSIAPDFWAWGDALYASGHAGFYDKLAREARNSRMRLDPGWAQVLVQDLAMPCGTGTCYLCALKTRGGVVLNCRDGPVYDLADWVVEE